MVSPWYDLLQLEDYSLEQGDFIFECPFIMPPKSINLEQGEMIDAELKITNSIILSQTCDLVNDKLEIVLLCPIYTLSDFIKRTAGDKNKKEKKKIISNLMKGYLPSYHLLNRDEKIAELNDYQVADFRNIYGLHIDFIKSFVMKTGNRIRLESPYKEHLSQSLARFFMRVGFIC